VRDLTVHHGQLRALDGISLGCCPERSTRSSRERAGKSTLLRTIAACMPDRGSILLDGRT